MVFELGFEPLIEQFWCCRMRHKGELTTISFNFLTIMPNLVAFAKVVIDISTS